MFQSATISAPGKVILFGEHSVVYGKRAIAFSLNMRTKATLSNVENFIRIDLPDIRQTFSWPTSSLSNLFQSIDACSTSDKSSAHDFTPEIEKILLSFLHSSYGDQIIGNMGLLAFLHLYTSILRYPIPVHITVTSEIPIGAGLGSSAAYSVCLSTAILYISENLTEKLSAHLDIINKWAFCSECIIHGRPSGLDNTICTFGGGVSFKSGSIEHIQPLTLRIIMVNSAVSRNTKLLVEKVKCKYEKFRSVMDPLWLVFDEISEKALKTLNDMKNVSTSNREVIDTLNELIDMNQCLLGCIGVSHSSLESIINTAKQYDLHAKLTGAGGGGFGLVLVDPHVTQKNVNLCIEELEAKGFTTFITELAVNGVTLTVDE